MMELKNKQCSLFQKLWSPPTSNLHNDTPSVPPNHGSHHGQSGYHHQEEDTGNSNPELAKYLDRSYWEQKKVESTSEGTRGRNSVPPASAPAQNTQHYGTHGSHYSTDHHMNHTSGVTSPDEASDTELDDFIRALKSQVEIFVNRMKSNSSRGRSIANDSSVQTLFVNITTMHSRLLKYIQQKDDKRVYYEGLQDKLTQVKDARAALNALREEHNEKLRREAAIAERQKQIQMAHKLDLMRKKKQEYLQYQRNLALQKIQEQEYEMQRRQEQQKQYYMQNNVAGFFDTGVPTGPPGPPPQYSQQPPTYHQAYNMLPPGAPGSELWAPDTKPLMNPNMLSMNQGPPSMNQGPPSMNQGPPSMNQGPMNQGPPSMSQGPQSLNPMNQGPPPIGQMGHPMQHPPQAIGPMGSGLGIGPNNPSGPMNPGAAQMTPSGPMNPRAPLIPQQPFQPPQQSGTNSNTSLNSSMSQHNTSMPQHNTSMPQHNTSMPQHNTSMPQHNTSMPQHNTSIQHHPPSDVKQEDNTAELISFD
ncbi:hypothetical protein M8J75_015296 [Diaphorina citri]|nr:hypothetical protein M8J75_015296 [Diaphorina citri]